MFSAGYLTIDRVGERRREYYLRIPNEEVKDYFRKTFIEIADSAGEEALTQIDKKIHETGLRERGIEKIIKIGMVFSGKELKLYVK